MQYEFLLKGLPETAVTFFAVFSRFEYARKRAGYVRCGRHGQAEADWDCFACRLGDEFLCRLGASTLRDHPPKRQVLMDGKLEWEKTCAINSTKDLFLAVRRVRNNLFHGGKYPSGPVPEASRDKELLEEATRILDLALNACSNIRGTFVDGLQS